MAQRPAILNGTRIAVGDEVTPNVGGALAVGNLDGTPIGGALASASAKATAVAPTYAEGSSVPLSVDLSGTLRTTAGAGGGGGGASTIADGADVAEGTTTDLAWVSGAGTVVSILKGIFGKLAGTLAVSVQNATLAVTQSGAWTQDVTDRAARLLGHVTVDNASIPVTGTFWQATQPVSGTFWQATQPVSGTVTANVGTTNGLALDGTDATGVAMPAGGVGIRGWLSSIFNKLNTSVAVTGTFWQATQPVSGTVTGNQGTPAAAANRWPVQVTDGTNLMPTGDAAARTIHTTVDNASVAVTGTFFQATQPVSGTVTANQGANNATPWNDNIAQVGGVAVAATAKGTQAANLVGVQEAKDAGRNLVHYYTLIPVLATATDTLQSLTGTKAGATVAATTTPAVVTAGKTLRIQRMTATYVATATSGYGVVRLRFNTAGVVAITSPVALDFAVGTAAPTTVNATDSVEAPVPDGLEFAAATGIGISVQGFAAATPTAVGFVKVSIAGYEY